MKTILCYGDSNTWGSIPGTHDRFPRSQRWTGILQRILGDEYYVIEEGCNGRTTVWDDPIEGDRNGKRYLPDCLWSHRPLDLVIIFLGVNDLKKRFSLSAYDIAKGAASLVTLVYKSGVGPGGARPKVLLISPASLAKLTGYAEMFEGGTEKSKHLADHFEQFARETGCDFLDAGNYIRYSDLDGGAPGCFSTCHSGGDPGRIYSQSLI